MARTARALALAATGLLAACSKASQEPCPGQPVGTFRFTVTDLGTPRPYCAAVPAEGTTVVGAFSGTLSQDAGLGTVALCLDSSKASPYYGRVEDGVFTLTASSGLAVLGVCGENCATSSVLTIEGSLDGGGTFAGTLTEAFEFSSGDCGTCVLPCAAVYGLTGVR
jgi:hypothetical protein